MFSLRLQKSYDQRPADQALAYEQEVAHAAAPAHVKHHTQPQPQSQDDSAAASSASSEEEAGSDDESESESSATGESESEGDAHDSSADTQQQKKFESYSFNFADPVAEEVGGDENAGGRADMHHDSGSESEPSITRHSDSESGSESEASIPRESDAESENDSEPSVTKKQPAAESSSESEPSIATHSSSDSASDPSDSEPEVHPSHASDDDSSQEGDSSPESEPELVGTAAKVTEQQSETSDESGSESGSESDASDTDSEAPQAPAVIIPAAPKPSAGGMGRHGWGHVACRWRMLIIDIYVEESGFGVVCYFSLSSGAMFVYAWRCWYTCGSRGATRLDTVIYSVQCGICMLLVWLSRPIVNRRTIVFVDLFALGWHMPVSIWRLGFECQPAYPLLPIS